MRRACAPGRFVLVLQSVGLWLARGVGCPFGRKSLLRRCSMSVKHLTTVLHVCRGSWMPPIPLSCRSACVDGTGTFGGEQDFTKTCIRHWSVAWHAEVPDTAPDVVPDFQLLQRGVWGDVSKTTCRTVFAIYMEPSCLQRTSQSPRHTRPHLWPRFPVGVQRRGPLIRREVLAWVADWRWSAQ